ncbi:MAG: hypothetical protein HY720_20875 [Planctomycetes bacterium]|nr:hypothetical protein [Planctomycetota bacterium]
MRSTYEVDVEIGDALVEVKSGLDAVRNLRLGMLQLVLALDERNVAGSALLVVAAPTMSPSRLEQEWHRTIRALRPDLASRLHLVLFENGRFEGLPESRDPTFRSQLERVVRKELERGEARLPRGEPYYEILKILVHRWMLDRGPMTSDSLARAAGCSYPTVASAIRRLGRSIVRRSYRRVELARFPTGEWATLVANSDRTRSTVRFSDSSGQPRSPESLVRRLGGLSRSDIAVGGVLGAKHYFPDLDIVGLPRLDLTIHARDSRTSLSFVDRLDPALRSSDDPQEPVALTVHFVRRSESLFDEAPDKTLWADPVECMLDLHEARLEPQAAEFLQHFADRRKATS